MPFNKLLISAFFVLPITFAHFPFGGMFGGFEHNNSENRTFPCRGRGRGHWNRTRIFPPHQGTNNSTNSNFGVPGNRRGNTEFGFPAAGNGRFGGFGTTGNGNSSENQLKQNNLSRSRRWTSAGAGRGEERQDLLRLISLIIQNGGNGTGVYGNITEALARIGLLPANNKNGHGHRFPRHAGRRLQNGTRNKSNSDSDENERQQFGRNANSGFGRGGSANSGFGRGAGLDNPGFGRGSPANSGFGNGGSENSGFGRGGESANSGFGRGGESANSGFGRGGSGNGWTSNGRGRNGNNGNQN